MFCHYCGILGHNLKQCAAHYAAEKNGGSMEYQYEDLLRAIGGHAKASVSQHTSPKSNTEEGIGSGPVQSSVPMVQQWMTAEAAREVGQENPKSAKEDDSMNPGIDIKITYADKVDYAGHANVKDGNSMVVRSSLEIMQSLNDNAELNKGLGEKLSFLKTNEGRAKYRLDGVQHHVLFFNNKTTEDSGPTISKPKNMWTRINRVQENRK